jgi:hypothetical protein
MSRRLFLSLQLLVVVLTAGCESPVTPDTTDSQTVRVSGRVFGYYRASEFVPIPGATLVGWIDEGASSRPTGRIPLDPNAHFSLAVERGARVRLYAGGDTGNETYQPCAVVVIANGDVIRNVSVVIDYRVIGAEVPPAFLEHTRTLSGVVYESVPGAGRRPVPWATVYVGGIRDQSKELGWPIANTRTDANGRYVICGLESDSNASIYVTTPDHATFESAVGLNTDTVLDIELKRTEADRR